MLSFALRVERQVMSGMKRRVMSVGEHSEIGSVTVRTIAFPVDDNAEGCGEKVVIEMSLRVVV